MDKRAAEHILGLSGSYDARKLKTAFRRLAAEHHPDAVEARGGDKATATARMQEINEAHDTLSALLDGTAAIRCDEYPPGGSMRPSPAAYRNPFDGSRDAESRHRARQGAPRQTTAEYYYHDPRFQTHADDRRGRARQARRDGSFESMTGRGSPVEEDPDRPNPRWYAPAHRLLAGFPYRLALLMGVCLLVNLTDPMDMRRTLGPLAFEEFLLLLALANLVFPSLTGPIRALLLWLLDRLRALSWRLSARRGRNGKSDAGDRA